MADLLLPINAGDLVPVDLTASSAPAPQPRPPHLSDDEIAEIRANVEASDAENTRRAYRTAWASFTDWCVMRGATPLPALPETVAAYLSLAVQAPRVRKDGTCAAPKPYSTTSLRLHLAAIKRAHRERQLSPPTEHPLVQRTWRGIRRRRGDREQGPDALTREKLEKVLAALPQGPRGVRDRALLWLGFAGAFRRSELAATRVCDVGFAQEEGVNWLTVDATRRKTGDKPVLVGLRLDSPGGQALVAWLDLLVDSNAPLSLRPVPLAEVETSFDGSALFRQIPGRAVTGKALSAQAIRRVVRRAATDAGLQGVYSAHSLRSGLATSMAQSGAGIFAIKAAGDWKAVSTLDRYVQRRRKLGGDPELDALLR